MTDSSFDLSVKAGILDILYRHSLVRNSANLFLALVVCFVYAGEVNPILVWVWGLAGLGIFAGRQFTRHLFSTRFQMHAASVNVWRRVYVLGLSLSGLHWFILLVFITPAQNPGLSMITFFIISGVTSAGYLSSCIVGKSSLWFLLLLVGGLGIHLQVDYEDHTMAILFVLCFYLYFINMVASHLRKALVENLRLYHEKTSLVDELDRARKRAEEASAEKTRFLGVTSHEIRTSVNGIVGIMQVMEDTMQTESGLDYLATMRKSSSDLLNHLNNLLDLNKIEEGRLTLESRVFDWQEMIGDAARLFENTARQKGIGVVLDFKAQGGVPRYVRGDDTRLGQILKNLISNGVKFTASGEVRVRAWVDQLLSGKVKLRIEVQDTGIGIEAGKQKDLFKTYVQEDDSVYRLYGGSGLGLSICQRIAELMGTEIRVQSEKGEGATFWFDPVLTEVSDQEILAQQVDPREVNPPLQSKKCLVVQDDYMSQKVGRLLLQKLGMQVDVVESGEKSVERVLTHPYDYVFMDIKMAGINGMEACQQIRALQLAHPQPKIIALTGSVMESERAAYAEAGMDGCLAKPLMLEELRAVFEN